MVVAVIIGKIMPVTPRVGSAAETIAIAVMVMSSPRRKAHCRFNLRSRIWIAMTTKIRKKAAGVAEDKPIGVPLSSIVV